MDFSRIYRIPIIRQLYGDGEALDLESGDFERPTAIGGPFVDTGVRSIDKMLANDKDALGAVNYLIAKGYQIRKGKIYGPWPMTEKRQRCIKFLTERHGFEAIEVNDD